MDNKAPDSNTNSDSNGKTKYFGNKETRHFFKQNTATGGTEVECWVDGIHFRHLIGTVELGTAEALEQWKQLHGMVLVDESDYLSHFSQVRRQVVDKYERKLQERRKIFQSRQNHSDNI